MQLADGVGQSVDQPDGLPRGKRRSAARADVLQVLREADAFDPGQHHIDMAAALLPFDRRGETSRL